MRASCYINILTTEAQSTQRSFLEFAPGYNVVECLSGFSRESG